MIDRFLDIKLEKINILAESISKELERRRIQLFFHRYLYYKLDNPIISDFEYDIKEYEYKILRLANPKVKIILSCPLNTVGIEYDRITESKVKYLIKYYLSLG